MNDVEPEVRDQIKADFTKLLEDKINAEILTQIPEAKLDEFSAILDSGDGAAAQAFCQQQVPNSAEIVAQVLVDFKLKYVGV